MNSLHLPQQLLLGFGMPGPFELAIIAGILLLLFGTRLPGVMRSMGRGVVEFKRGLAGEDDDAAVSNEEAPTQKSKP
jgi:sec-independent protein translocase protein TatA